MFYFLKRHPFPVAAHFQHSLVLTYALPREVLQPLLSPGLELDTFGEWGFLAIALVQTRDLRPRGLPPALGRDFFLSGYRIFSRFRTRRGRNLRGLKILRSDADSRLMVTAGNLLTHYHYRLARVTVYESETTLEIEVKTPNGEADLKVCAALDSAPAPLPEGSPFSSLEEARHFAGPLPFTFDYEAPTHSMVVVKGIRSTWNPQPVRVQVERATFLDRPPFRDAGPRLANAFYLRDVPYRWERGRREPIND